MTTLLPSLHPAYSSHPHMQVLKLPVRVVTVTLAKWPLHWRRLVEAPKVPVRILTTLVLVTTKQSVPTTHFAINKLQSSEDFTLNSPHSSQTLDEGSDARTCAASCMAW